jgi:hypothetical protein
MSIFSTASSEVQSDEWKYNSIGGWLIVIAIGLCVSPLLQLLFIVRDLLPVFMHGGWHALTTPGSPAYHRLWAPVILFEFAMNLGFIAMEAILLFWLFRQSRRFPTAMIVYLLTVFVLVAADYFVAQSIPVVAAQDDPESRVAFMRAGIVCAIWVPYFLKSKRVKGTFTR